MWFLKVLPLLALTVCIINGIRIAYKEINLDDIVISFFGGFFLALIYILGAFGLVVGLMASIYLLTQ